ncbi:MAG: peptidoglycan DD-metalloendopeptidase family protein [Azovibrio sp.]|uniref:peptidoglycan DD-metalloendopeptidase family protein n=1 Tax=Azovibrio sp. TaxID=1872673 RepID=UPI003C780E14
MIKRLPIVLSLLLLAACASKFPAPVEDRSSSLKSTAAPVGPGYHTVQPRETLYAIALEYGQDYRDIASWNNIADPNRITVGQTLRVLPPAGQEAAVASPVVTSVAAGAGVEQRPLADGGGSPASSGSLKRDPKVSKIPYSEAAYAQLQNPGPAATKPPEGKPEPPVAASTSTAAAASTPATPEERVPDGVTWSWPAQGKVISNFAQTKGVDIAGKAGDPVLAAADGKVVYAGSGLRGYGQLVIVKHDATFLSAYAHNQKILVKEGQSVKRGQKIAEMGNTDSNTVKLHFEVRRQGKPVEPLDFLPKR